MAVSPTPGAKGPPVKFIKIMINKRADYCNAGVLTAASVLTAAKLFYHRAVSA